MSYKITITKIEEKETIKQEWERLFDVDETTQRAYYNAGSDTIKNYGYVDHKVVEEVATNVFQQTVDNMNIKKVIKAINDIYEPDSAAGGSGGSK